MEQSLANETNREEIASLPTGARNDKSRYGLFLKTISSVVVVAFLLQDFVYAQGGPPLWSKVTKTYESTKAEEQLNPITIPPESGLARKVVAKGTNDIIINIQDAHSKLGAQDSIVKILDNLVKNYDLSVITLEGASGR